MNSTLKIFNVILKAWYKTSFLGKKKLALNGFILKTRAETRVTALSPHYALDFSSLSCLENEHKRVLRPKV